MIFRPAQAADALVITTYICVLRHRSEMHTRKHETSGQQQAEFHALFGQTRKKKLRKKILNTTA